MNDKVVDANESPDFLAAPTSRGKGVRRLNRLPLIVVIGILSLAVLAITYTFFQRQAQQQRVASAPVDPGLVQNPATAPVRPENFAPPAPPPMPEPPAEKPIVPPIHDGPAATAPAKPSPELEARLRIIRRIEENKIAQAEAALASDPTVRLFRGRGDRPTDGADTEMPPSLAGLASAANALRQAAATGTGTGFGLDSGLGGGFNGGMDQDPNRQDHKRAFLSQSPELETYLKHTRTPPISSMEIKAGTIIPAVMISGINSDLPGQIIGQVRENVYDTATGQHLLIPAGARLVGTYDSTVTMGQERVLVAWRRIIYPDGSSVSLDLMPGADTSGYAGFNDKVNNHYWRIFGNALMLSLFSAGIQLSQPEPRGDNYYDSQQILAAEIGRQMGQLGMEMARRNMMIQPTLEIRPGYRFVVMVTKDIVLPPWQGHPLAAGHRTQPQQ